MHAFSVKFWKGRKKKGDVVDFFFFLWNLHGTARWVGRFVTVFSPFHLDPEGVCPRLISWDSG